MALEGEDVTGALFGDQGTGGDGGQGGGQAEGDKGGGDAAGQGGEGGGDGGAAPDWFEKVSAEAQGDAPSHRDWLTAKGVKDLDGLVKFSRDTEKALRDGGRVKLPGEGAKPEEVAAYRAAIGVPEKVDGYAVKAPDGVKLNEPLIGRILDSALKHGGPKSAIEGVIGDFIQAQMDEAAQATADQNKQVADKVKEWGPARAENEVHINSAARALGLTREDMAWMRTMPGGAGRALDMMVKLGSGMAEDVMMTGGKGRFGISGAEAQKELDTLKSDAEFQAKNKPGTPERARWDRLNQAASEWTAAQAQAA